MTNEDAKDYIREWCPYDKQDEIIKALEQQPCDAISREQVLSDYADWFGYGYRDNAFYKHLKDMPSVQPKPIECEDCISRAEAIKAMDELEQEDIEAYGCSIPEGFDGERARKAICLLPSVQPKAKVGHWIESNIPHEKYVCSECGGACWYYDHEGDVAKSRYCPNCGAKMEE